MKKLIKIQSDDTTGKYTDYVDKIRFKDYCTQNNIATIPTYRIIEDADLIEINDILQYCAVKSNTGCGCNIFIADYTIMNGPLVNADIRNPRIFKLFIEELKKWKHVEHNIYKQVHPKIIIEKLISNLTREYKMEIFNGKVMFIRVIDNMNNNELKCDKTLNPDWSDSGCKHITVKKCDYNIDKPPQLNELIEKTERLAKPFPHARVDMYIIDGTVIAGEMTFDQEEGKTEILEPIECSQKMVRAWNESINVHNKIQ